jgi:hypothetical protein
VQYRITATGSIESPNDDRAQVVLDEIARNLANVELGCDWQLEAVPTNGPILEA